MLVLVLTLLSLTSVTLSQANCNDYMLECLMTHYNGSLWLMSMEESCLLEPNTELDTTYSSFPCYRIDNNDFIGLEIVPGCNLKWNCQKVENLSQTNRPSEFPLVILIGTAFAIMTALFK